MGGDPHWKGVPYHFRYDIVDGSEILHHPTCMKPCKHIGRLPYQLVQDFRTINSSKRSLFIFHLFAAIIGRASLEDMFILDHTLNPPWK